MKISRTIAILFFLGLVQISKSKVEAQQINGDSVYVTSINARFVRKTMDEYCGDLHLPERNMFETTKWENGVFVRKYFEAEYSTDCRGTNLIPGKSYSFSVIKRGETILNYYLRKLPQSFARE